MCERYVMADAEQAEREFGVVRRWWQFSPSFNVGPSRYVPVIRMHDGQVEGVMLRWGLIPDWAEADAAKACAVTASISEVEHAPRPAAAGSSDAAASCRCSGSTPGSMTWQGHRQPFFVRLVNRPVFGVAAVWDRTEAEDGDDVIESCALITVPPNPLLAELQGIGQEMPAILDRRDYAVWLTARARGREDRAQAAAAAADGRPPGEPADQLLSLRRRALIRPDREHFPLVSV
jgi:putative SOS response-associated peptidase YedK